MAKFFKSLQSHSIIVKLFLRQLQHKLCGNKRFCKVHLILGTVFLKSAFVEISFDMTLIGCK